MIALLSGVIIVGIIALVALIAVATDLLQQRNEARETLRRIDRHLERQAEAAKDEAERTAAQRSDVVGVPLLRIGKGTR